MSTLDLTSKSAALAYLKSLGSSPVNLPSSGELASAAADAVSVLADEHSSVFARNRGRWNWPASELVALFDRDFSGYRVFISSDPSHWGEATTKTQAAELAADLARRAQEAFPGLVVDVEYVIGSRPTRGPEQDVIDDIDAWLSDSASTIGSSRPAGSLRSLIEANDDGQWLTGGTNIETVAAEWAATGLSQDYIVAYWSARVWSADAAAKLAAAGVTPDQAGTPSGQDVGGYSDTVGYKVANADMSVAEAAASIAR